jgi:hypothetical protein
LLQGSFYLPTRERVNSVLEEAQKVQVQKGLWVSLLTAMKAHHPRCHYVVKKKKVPLHELQQQGLIVFCWMYLGFEAAATEFGREEEQQCGWRVIFPVASQNY